MANSNNRQVMLTAKLTALRGVERALDRLGWHHIYSPPTKRPVRSAQAQLRPA